MNRLFMFLGILGVIEFFSPIESLSQWAIPNGPGGGYLNGLSSDGTSIYSGTDKGVFSTSDEGRSWKSKISGLTPLSVHCFAFRDINIYAGSWGYGVYLSTDKGQTWNSINNGADVLGCRALATYKDQLYAGVYGGVYASTNAGQQWTKTSLKCDDIRALIVDSTVTGSPVLVVGSGGYGVGGPGLFRSTDGGTSWTNVSNANWISCMTMYGSKIYAGADDRVLVSVDHGETWAPWPAGTLTVTFNSLTVTGSAVPPTVFAGTSSGLYRSIGGQAWVKIVANYVSSLVSSGNNIVALVSTNYPNQEVILSTDQGSTWENRQAGLIRNEIKSLYVNDSLLFAGTETTGLFLSRDKGDNWLFINNGLGDRTVLSIVNNGLNYYAGTDDGIFFSTDRGASWIARYSLPMNTSVRSLLFKNTQLFAGTSQGVFVSTGNDTSWSFKNIGLTNIDVRTLVDDDSTLLAGTGGGIFMSHDSASTWLAANSGLNEEINIRSLAHEGRIIYAGTAGGLFFSTNSGALWSKTSMGSATNNIRSVAVSPPNKTDSTVIVTTSFGKRLYLSPNSGLTWRYTPNDYYWDSDSINVGPLAISDSNVFVAGHKGVWRYPLSISMWTSVERSATGQPIGFRLEQNYPNPFNSSTMIKYNLSKHSHITLLVYNILGQEIRQLVNSVEEGGEHNVLFDASGLSSGLYFYRLQSDSFLETRKLVLSK